VDSVTLLYPPLLTNLRLRLSPFLLGGADLFARAIHLLPSLLGLRAVLAVLADLVFYPIAILFLLLLQVADAVA
jgi:hypothetical protein